MTAPSEGLSRDQREVEPIGLDGLRQQLSPLFTQREDGLLTCQDFEGLQGKERSDTPHRRLRGWRTPRRAPIEQPCCTNEPFEQTLRATLEPLVVRLEHVVKELEVQKERQAAATASNAVVLVEQQKQREEKKEGGVLFGDQSKFLRSGCRDLVQRPRGATGVSDMICTSTAPMDPAELAKKELKRKREDRLNSASLALISMNAVYLGIEAELEMRSARAGHPPPTWLRVVNGGFALAFIAELGVKACLIREDFWRRKDERWWNLFDVVLVLTAILDAMQDVLFANVNVAYMRVIRIFRGIKAARILRAIGKVHNLRLMVASIVTSAPTLVWACVLLGLVIYMCALIIMPGVQSKIESSANEIDDKFGSLPAAVLTLYMSITGGMDWNEGLTDLQKVHWLFTPFFVLFVGISSFSLTGVLTAVIIEASKGILWVDKDLVIQKTIRDDKEKRGHLCELFQSIQKHGHINQRTLMKALTKEDNQALFKSLDLDICHARKLFELCDEDKSGFVDQDEFVSGLMKHRGVMTTVLDETRALSEQMDRMFDKLASALGTASWPARQLAPSPT